MRKLNPQLVPVGLATAGAALFLVSSPAAMAASKNWNSESDPLIAWEDGDKLAFAHGTAYTKEGSLKNHTYYLDADPDNGNDVYTETGYSYYEWSTGFDTMRWSGVAGKDQSERTDSGEWVDQYDADYYADHYSADRARVYYKVCEDQSWSPDECSANPYKTFTL